MEKGQGAFSKIRVFTVCWSAAPRSGGGAYIRKLVVLVIIDGLESPTILGRIVWLM